MRSCRSRSWSSRTSRMACFPVERGGAGAQHGERASQRLQLVPPSPSGYEHTFANREGQAVLAADLLSDAFPAAPVVVLPRAARGYGRGLTRQCEVARRRVP